MLAHNIPKGTLEVLYLISNQSHPPPKTMYYTLSQLRQEIQQKIVEQGEAAPVAAFIFTRQDVVTEDNECNGITYPDGVVHEVLIGIGDSDYIYEMILDKIEIEIAEVIDQTNVSQEIGETK